MFKKMRNRLLLINMVVLSLIMIAAFTTVYLVTYSNIQRENEQKLGTIPVGEVDSGQNSSISEEEGAENSFTRSDTSLPVDYSNSFAILLNDDDSINKVLSYIDLSEEAYYEAFEAWKQAPNGRITLGGREWQYQTSSTTETKVMQIDGKEQVIEKEHNHVVFLDITDSLNSLTRLMVTFLIVGVIMLVALFFVSLYFANRSMKPIEDMWNKQRQFVTDASHELKTPLFSINSNMAVLRSNADATVGSQSKWLDYIDSETGRMGKLIGDLLYLAKAETIEETFLPFDFRVLVENAVTSIEAVVYEKGIRLNCSLAPQAIVSGDEEKLKQVVFILLDNAVKYTEKNGVVDVYVIKTKHHVKLLVGNSGNPIPQNQLSKIFDRFYRGDQSRSSETEGYGLGLSIAKTIVERSGGEIDAESGSGRTIFTVTLKKHD